MRLLYFHQHFSTPAGASGTRSYEFARELVRRGHRVTVVCGAHALSGLTLPADDARGWSRGTVDGIDVISLPLPYSNRDSLLRRAFVFARFALRSAAIALREEADLVFATSTPISAALPGLAAKWFRGTPFVFEVRDLWPDLPRALGVTNPLTIGVMTLIERLAYRSADAVIGLAPGIVDAVRARSAAGLPVTLVPNGCDLEAFAPGLRAAGAVPGVSPDDFVAGFTGAHGPANGLDAVLEAARELNAPVPAALQLAFIGDGREKDRLAGIARAEGLDNCVFLPPVAKSALGPVTASFGCGLMVLKDVPEFRRGTSPNKFFDYLAAGVPVINNYPGWVADLVAERGCGVVVPPGDPVAFADAMQRLAADPAACRAMGAAARRLAEERFARRSLAADFCAALESAARL
ncbi:MAG: glycosyltransferase family 4 protein [Opitutia bacterium]